MPHSVPTLESLLTPLESATLRSALDRIIPADEFPSACQAGVDLYLARQLAGDLSEELDSYRGGLAGLNRAAEELFRTAFPLLAAERQDEILAAAENGDVSAFWPTSPVRFMTLLCSHAAEGYYGDPGNGGNLDCISWKMVGFDPSWSVDTDGSRG